MEKKPTLQVIGNLINNKNLSLADIVTAREAYK